jgi:hypothetical protein
VVPALPLALLEAIRSHDRPGEFLEDEDLTRSMPRRLGLTGVILRQIRMYETAHAANRRVPLAEAVDLLRLVLRRPDAATILDETGRRVTRLQLEKRFSPIRSMHGALPRGVVFAGARRAARRLLDTITGDATVHVTGKPLSIRIEDALTGRMDSSACQLYTGVLEELVILYLGSAHAVAHVRCSARGDETCEWATES